jgi:hypothetical protein
MGKFVKGAHTCADNKSQSNKYRHMSCKLLLAPSQFLVFPQPQINLGMPMSDASTGEPAQGKASIKKIHQDRNQSQAGAFLWCQQYREQSQNAGNRTPPAH